LVDDEAAMGLLDRGAHGAPVPGRERPQVEQLHVDVRGGGGELAALDHRAPADHRHLGPGAHPPRLPVWHHELVARVGSPRPGAAKRLRVRQRSVPQSFSCSAAESAYLRNWISATGSNPASAMPTARPTMPSSERLVSNTRGAPYLSCSPRVAPCTPPLGPTSSPKTSMRGFSASSTSRVRRIAVSMLMRGPDGRAVRLAGAVTWPSGASPPCSWSARVPSGFSKKTCCVSEPGSGGGRASAPSTARSTPAPGSEPSPSRIVRPENERRFAAMLPPGVCRCEDTEIPKPLSSM